MLCTVESQSINLDSFGLSVFNCGNLVKIACIASIPSSRPASAKIRNSGEPQPQTLRFNGLMNFILLSSTEIGTFFVLPTQITSISSPLTVPAKPTQRKFGCLFLSRNIFRGAILGVTNYNRNAVVVCVQRRFECNRMLVIRINIRWKIRSPKNPHQTWQYFIQSVHIQRLVFIRKYLNTRHCNISHRCLIQNLLNRFIMTSPAWTPAFTSMSMNPLIIEFDDALPSKTKVHISPVIQIVKSIINHGTYSAPSLATVSPPP